MPVLVSYFKGNTEVRKLQADNIGNALSTATKWLTANTVIRKTLTCVKVTDCDSKRVVAEMLITHTGVSINYIAEGFDKVSRKVVNLTGGVKREHLTKFVDVGDSIIASRGICSTAVVLQVLKIIPSVGVGGGKMLATDKNGLVYICHAGVIKGRAIQVKTAAEFNQLAFLNGFD